MRDENKRKEIGDWILAPFLSSFPVPNLLYFYFLSPVDSSPLSLATQDIIHNNIIDPCSP